jgi:hypothetical protein
VRVFSGEAKAIFDPSNLDISSEVDVSVVEAKYGGTVGGQNGNIGSYLQGKSKSADLGGGIHGLGVKAKAHAAVFEGCVHPTTTVPIPFTSRRLEFEGTLGGQVVAVGADAKLSVTRGFHLKLSALLGFDLGLEWKLADRE